MITSNPMRALALTAAVFGCAMHSAPTHPVAQTHFSSQTGPLRIAIIGMVMNELATNAVRHGRGGPSCGGAAQQR